MDCNLTNEQGSGFDKWFRHYMLHNTESCLDRDILRWAKPVLKVGFDLQARDNKLEFKGAQVYLDNARIIQQLQSRLKEAEVVVELADDIETVDGYYLFLEAVRQYKQKYKDKE